MKPGGVLGSRTWISSAGTRLRGTLESISKDGKSVTLKPSDGKKPITVPVDKLSGHDQALIKGLQATPSKVTLDPTGLPEANQQSWLENVICGFGELGELPDGKELLSRIRDNRNGIRIEPRTGKDNFVTYSPKNGGSSDVVVHYDPIDTEGDVVERGEGGRERPPFIALGKELSTGDKAARTSNMPPPGAEETAAAKFENILRDQYNKLESRRGKQALPRRIVP